MRFAFVGLGEAACGLHLPALARVPRAQVVGGCDLAPERRSAWARAAGVTAFETLDELLSATAPDVVVVATPPDAHADACLRAFEAGAHVLCEKPLAATLEDADRILAAATVAERRVAVNHHFRYQPIFSAIKERIDAGGDGRLVLCQLWQLSDQAPWDEPTGWRAAAAGRSLMEGGVHLVDLLLHLHGEPPTAVLASISPGAGGPPGADAIALVTLEFVDDRLAQLTIDRRCPAATRFAELRADCERASLRASVGGRASLRIGKKRAARSGARLDWAPGGVAWTERGLRRETLARNPRVASVRATAMLVEDFLFALADGREPPSSGREARDAVATIEAAYRSARSGRRVELATLAGVA